MYSNYDNSTFLESQNQNGQNGQNQPMGSIFVRNLVEINRQFQRQSSSRSNNVIKAEDFDDSQSVIKPPSRPESTESQTQPHSFEEPNADVSLTEPITTYKCELCPFICLAEASFNDHIQQHNFQKFARRKIYCAGCQNTFYTSNALKVHLSEDHFMTAEEAAVLTSYTIKNNSFGPTTKGKKNRIRIKNVQTLKKPDLLLESSEAKEAKKQSKPKIKDSETPPTLIPITNEYENSFEFAAEQESCQNLYPSRSTICIKSLEALRDPVRPPVFPSHLPSPNFYDQLEDTSLQQFATIATNLPLQETENTEDDPQNKNKIFVKNINILQQQQQTQHQPIQNQNPPMTTLHFDSVSMLGLNDNIDTSFEIPGFTLDLQQHRTQVDEVVILDENELSDLIEVNNNFSQNSVEMHNFTDLLDDNNQCNFSEQIIGEPSNSNPEEKSILLSEKDVSVLCPSQSNTIENACDEAILIVCAEEIVKEDETPKGRIYVASNLMESDSNCNREKRKSKRCKPSIDNGLEKCGIDKCTWQFKEISNLNYHRKCHGESKSIKCAECQSEFRNWNTCATHLWRQHQIDMELFACSFEGCNFKSPSFSRLSNEHRRIHFEERKFHCKEKDCDKKFKNAKQRKHHTRLRHKLKTTTNGISIKCEMCTSVFTTQTALRNHNQRMHMSGNSSADDTKCSKCDKKFPNAAALKGHSKQHWEEKKYKCSECDYLTNDHNAYRRHKMTHSKASCYQCPYCPYRSIQSTTYRKHLESKHEEQACDLVFKCSQCKFVSISRNKYDLHVAKHEQSSNQEKSDKSIQMVAQEKLTGNNANKVYKEVPQQIPSPKLRIRTANFAQVFGQNEVNSSTYSTLPSDFNDDNFLPNVSELLYK